MTAAVEKEFIFIDESGDPGLIGNPVYILIGIHVTASALDEMRRHVVAFRYHHDVVREFKAQRWADKLNPPAFHLFVDSAYVDAIQVADIYARLLRRVVSGGATPDEERLTERLMDVFELRGGLK